MNTDPIADYLTRIRNALKARHPKVSMPSSRIKVELSKILQRAGYIVGYHTQKCSPQDSLELVLKYDLKTKYPAIDRLIRVSKPGLRKYSKAAHLPQVRNGLGIAIVSTAAGLLSDKEARTKGIGGEVLCMVD